ncbi:MAG: dephospho-CoA kinase [Elusimicrobia bacterium]|nr:dephospho-CoA kinase [Elusimicrobiota bacterium]
MLKIGITGSMGSGKSTVAGLLMKQGIPVILVDELVRSYQSPGNIAWAQIRGRWGDKYMADSGELDRRKLAADMLADRNLRAELEGIIHPLARQEVLKIFNIWAGEGVKVGAADVPLLFEAGWKDIFDRIIVTHAPEDVLVRRITEKRGITEEEAKKWLSIQSPQEDKIKEADAVIETQEEEKEIEKNIKNTIKEFKRRK